MLTDTAAMRSERSGGRQKVQSLSGTVTKAYTVPAARSITYRIAAGGSDLCSGAGSRSGAEFRRRKT